MTTVLNFHATYIKLNEPHTSGLY